MPDSYIRDLVVLVLYLNPDTGLQLSCRAWPLSARTAEAFGAGLQAQQLVGVVVISLLASVSGLSKDG